MDEANLSDLILVPTELERTAIESKLRGIGERWSIETIGFGVIAAGVRTARLLTEYSPSRVVLAGIAGLFGPAGPGSSDASPSEAGASEASASGDAAAFDLGDAVWFDAVAIDGIGVGQGDDYVDAAAMGWRWDSGQDEAGRLHLELPAESKAALLLTVCSGSANADDASRRARRFPDAVAEDMESYAVAHACASGGVPLSVVRGFSNFVGRRDRSQWKVDAALQSVAEQLQRVID